MAVDRLERRQERVYPEGPAPPLEEAEAERDRRRLRALGVARAGAAYQQGEPVGAGEAGEPVVVEGVRGRWRVDPDALATLEGLESHRTTLLAPFDILLQDRKRMTDLLGFDYALEMYKPKAKRRWGYYALPVLHGDRLVGKVDASADHEAGELVAHAAQSSGVAEQLAERAGVVRCQSEETEPQPAHRQVIAGLRQRCTLAARPTDIPAKHAGTSAPGSRRLTAYPSGVAVDPASIRSARWVGPQHRLQRGQDHR